MSYRGQQKGSYGVQRQHRGGGKFPKKPYKKKNDSKQPHLPAQMTPQVQAYDGKSISIQFDGQTLKNTIRIVPHEVWCASWSKSPDILIDDDIPEKWHLPLALHETLEKYLAQRYGLSGTVEGHFMANAIEKKWFMQHYSEEDCEEYERIVDTVGRKELEYLEKKH